MYTAAELGRHLGGAGKSASELFTAYRGRHYDSWLVVGKKRSTDFAVLEVPQAGRDASSLSRLCWAVHSRLSNEKSQGPVAEHLRRWLRVVAEGRKGVNRAFGREDLDYPTSRRLLEFAPCRPDIVHAHNLHGGYCDVRFLTTVTPVLPLPAGVSQKRGR